MSSTVFTEQDSSPVQTRRLPMRTAELENGSQPTNNRRSLSGKFRNLFRKSSSSPSRSVINNNEGRLPQAPVRQPSPSPPRTATEAPHLRAPLVKWPFGRKKNKTTDTTTKEKTKRKSKKKTPTSMEISTPIHEEEHRTSIYGQNFVPRTPELTHGGTGRTHSSSSYDANTKGFRDFMIIDHTQSSRQGIPSNNDVITPPPYVNDRSRSPSLNQQTLTDTYMERSSYHDMTTPISDIEVIPIPKQTQYYQGEKPPLRSTQTLIDSIPLLHSTIAQPADVNAKNTSNSSLNHTEFRSPPSSSMDVDYSKFNAPVISSTKIDSNQTDTQAYNNSTYHSSSTVNKFIQPNPTNPYTSLPNIYSENSGGFTPIKPMTSDGDRYPTLSAIVQHHMRPMGSIQSSNKRSSPTKKNPVRFDTSTATINDYDQRSNQPWSRIQINSSSSCVPPHDGFIRPLTPPNDRSIITSNPAEPPVIYRSSTIIYTRDKHNYADGGELRTWSMQDHQHHTKPSTSIQILPARIINEYQYQVGNKQLQSIPSISEQQRVQAQYTLHRYPDPMTNSHRLRFSSNNEREEISHPSTRSNHTQESFNSITPVKHPEVTLRHYELQRTDSYDGLGILLSTDPDTRLNHRIREIENDSPGYRAGLRVNDRIVNVNGVNVEQTDFNDVLLLIKEGLNNNKLAVSVRNE